MKIKWYNKNYTIGPKTEFKWKNATKFEYRNIKSKDIDVNIMVLSDQDGDKLVLPIGHNHPKVFVNLINKLNKEGFQDG